MLVRDLQSKVAEERTSALDAIAKVDLGPTKKLVLTILRNQLASTTGAARAQVAHTLGKLGKGDISVARALIKVSTDDNPVVRATVLKALLNLEVSRDITLPIWLKLLQSNDHESIMHLIHSMADLGAQSVPALRDALQHPQAAYWACLVVSEIGADAAELVPELIELVDHAKPEVQLQAIVALGHVQGDSDLVVPELCKVIRGEWTLSSKYAACFALGHSGSKRAIPALTDCLTETDDAELKLLSGWAILLLEPESNRRTEALEAIIAGLSSKNSHIRVLALRALSDIPLSKAGPSSRVMQAMVQALNDSDPNVISGVINALASKGPASVKIVQAGLGNKDLQHHAVELARRLGPDAADGVADLVSTLKSSEDKVLRREIHFALGAIGPKASSAIEAVKIGLFDDDNDVRYSACYALGQMGNAAAAAAPDLKKCLECDDSFMRLAAVWTMLQIDATHEALADRAVPTLTEALSHQNEFIRAEAARALGSLGQSAASAREKLAELKSDHSETVRDAVQQSLKKIQ